MVLNQRRRSALNRDAAAMHLAAARMTPAHAGTVETPPYEVAATLLVQAVIGIRMHVQGRLRTQGLTHSQWRALRLVASVDSLPATEMAKGLGLDTGAATRLVDRLEAKGLCRRRRSVMDRRVVHLELTDDGASVLERTSGMVADVLAEHFTDVKPHEMTTLQDVLTRILNRCTPGIEKIPLRRTSRKAD